MIDAKFIFEVWYIEWVPNVILVKNASKKWRMCVVYTDLNQTCLKYSYPLSNIDKLVDNAYDYKLLSFMDTYSDYDQILMYEDDKDKISFMIGRVNYQYKVVYFGLKNEGVMYQRMMNKIFEK